MPDGSTAVNVGPIVRALQFVTDGRGEDRGTDEAGNPLPDLMSLAFDVVEAIILGGRKADYFRQVKRDLEAQTAEERRSSLSLAKQARRVHAPSPPTSIELAADSLQALLAELSGLTLAESVAQELKLALESFRAFGADRWVSATAQLLVAVSALSNARPPREELPAPTPVERVTRKKRKKRPPSRAAAPLPPPPKPRRRAAPKARAARKPVKAQTRKPRPKKAPAKKTGKRRAR